MMRRIEFARVSVRRVAVLDLRFRAAIIVTALDVHHARDRIRAVGGRGAILQNLDALDGR